MWASSQEKDGVRAVEPNEPAQKPKQEVWGLSLLPPNGDSTSAPAALVGPWTLALLRSHKVASCWLVNS